MGLGESTTAQKRKGPPPRPPPDSHSHHLLSCLLQAHCHSLLSSTVALTAPNFTLIIVLLQFRWVVAVTETYKLKCLCIPDWNVEIDLYREMVILHNMGRLFNTIGTSTWLVQNLFLKRNVPLSCSGRPSKVVPSNGVLTSSRYGQVSFC